MPDDTIPSNANSSDAGLTEGNLNDADLDAVTGGWWMPPAPAPATTVIKANSDTVSTLAGALKA